MKIPVLAVIGAKEAESGQVSLRSRREADLGCFDQEQLVRAAIRADRLKLGGLTWDTEASEAD
jgi:threonyl-tRNA synthetase